MSGLVAIDSNALTYLVEAIEPGYDPAQDAPDLAAERVSMIRTYLYAGVQLWVLPTVEVEYDRIRCASRHLRHQRAAWILLHDAPLDAPSNALAWRARQLELHHAGEADCRIVAESEASGVGSLLTRDDTLIRDLRPHAKVRLQYPSRFWASLRIGAGAKPVREPSAPNPLAYVSWWRV